MSTYVIITRADLEAANLCQEALDFFDLYTGGSGVFEAEWTNLHEITIQQTAPWIVGWLRAKRLVPYPDLSGEDLSGLDLKGADFRGADLSGAILCDTNLENAQLQRCVLIGTDLEGASLENVNVDKAVLQYAYVGIDFAGEIPAGWTNVEGFLVKT